MSQNVDLGIWHRLSQLMIALLVAAFLLGVFFWYLPLLQQNERMRSKILTLEGKVKFEEQRQATLEGAIKSLREDPKTVERLAREKLGYAKPGETVIFFEPPTGR